MTDAKKITELEEALRYERMRSKAYNEQFLTDKDEKERLNRLHETQTKLLWSQTDKLAKARELMLEVCKISCVDGMLDSAMARYDLLIKETGK